MTVEAKLEEMSLKLPAAAAPVASYVSTVVHGGVMHVSGQIAWSADGQLIKGTLGAGMDVDAGMEAAKRCALAVVAQVGAALGGDFDRVERFVKLGVFVASAPDFFDQPKVANGASDLLVALFGERGKHARAAVGVAALPLGVAVEVDAVVAVR